MTAIADSSDTMGDSGAPGPSASTASGTEGTATASANSPAVTDMDAEDFRIDGDRYGFLLADGRTACEFSYSEDAAGGATNATAAGGNTARDRVANAVANAVTGATGAAGNVSGTCHVRELQGTAGQPAPDTIVFDAGGTTEGAAPGIYAEATAFRLIAAPDIRVLNPNQRVEIGPFTCTALGTAAFSCDMGAHSVTVSDGIADGALFRESTESTRPATRAMRPLPGNVTAGADCGNVASEEFEHIEGPLRVTAGTVDCSEILPIIYEYINTPIDAHHGNWNVRQYRNWTCSMPTAATYEREGQHVTCGDGTGNAVAIEGDRTSRG